MKKKVILEGRGLDRFFNMHGRRGDTVYRRKRNGEYEQYAFEYHPPGGNSPLKDRTCVLNRFANTISNPQYKGYSAILRKLYYYTPYFLTPGDYALQGQTVFFVRQAGNYQLEWSGSGGISWQQKICRRTLVKISFNESGEQQLVLKLNGVEHCARKFIILSSEADIQAVYTNWLDEHLEEVLAQPEPVYSRVKIYRRGLEPRTNVMQGLSGTYQSQIYYWHKNSEISFLRKNYDHSANRQSQLFKEQKALAISAWNAETEEYKAKWTQEFWQWYEAKYRSLNRMMTPFMWYVSYHCRI
ncbi:MAG: hypothetical protein RAO94_11555 [Candidatus Stygibacter australis]|nr:hypothetical protein [Candidatus Stygibacter australis]